MKIILTILFIIAIIYTIYLLGDIFIEYFRKEERRRIKELATIKFIETKRKAYRIPTCDLCALGTKNDCVYRNCVIINKIGE
jgi:hypothetical protein